jgi:aryl-alcohol dehydrogenase-like predicted oxidoreductase
MKRTHDFGFGLPPACRLGLATRGNTHLDPEDVLHAVERGINYLNWCGHSDGLSRAVREMGSVRKNVIVAWQIQSNTADGARRELENALTELGTDRIDLVTLYYVESESEWVDIASRGGAYEALADARSAGQVGMIGMTSHQRAMAAAIGAGELLPKEDALPDGLDPSRPLDALMLRYNAAHRGADKDVFPVTVPIGLPVVVYTCLRWGALMKPTPEDPEDYAVPAAPEWYRYALANPSVAVALMAPNGRAELDQDLALLDDWRPPSDPDHRAMTDHGDRVYRTAGGFP